MCEVCEEWSIWILRLERRGCLCGSLASLPRMLSACLSTQPLSTCSIYSLTSFLKVLLCSLGRERLCGSLAEAAALLKRLKVELGATLYASWAQTRDPFLRASLESALFPLLFVLPCAPQSCESLCRAFLSAISPSAHILPLFLPLLNWEEEEEEPYPDCGATVPSNGDRDKHRSAAVKFIGVALLNQWKSLFASVYTPEDSPLRDKHIFISIWNICVRLHSSACYPGFKNFVSNLNHIVAVPSPNKNPLLWKLEVEVLNTALCYGSTLGLQNEIPGDIFSLSQRLIALSKSNEYYAALVLPKTLSPGIAGHCVRSEEEGKVDISLGHKLILLHLKAIAILVREAQCCSSSEESDASSGGAESLHNADLLNIEKSILDIVRAMTEWMRSTFLFQHEASFLCMFMNVFREQDDVLIEGLLCLLDIYIGSKISSPDLSPLTAFQLFAESISLDHSVLLDFLLSNETCFLLYFLRFLKYLNRGSRVDLITTPPHVNVYNVLLNLKNSIDKLTDKGLFPYDISPVHKLLKHLIK